MICSGKLLYITGIGQIAFAPYTMSDSISPCESKIC